jgi:site-specific DNA-cytosine methylase
MKRDAITFAPDVREIRHFHLFAGLGGGAKGFNQGEARVGNMEARFRCIGGIDVDPAAVRDFGRLAGVPGTVLDLFDRSQYVRFWGRQPPAGWHEATPQDIKRAAGGERPHIVFLSAPCKAFSGLLSAKKSLTGKYIALSELTVRGMWLMLEAWRDDPPELIIFENVPMIATRGRALLDKIQSMLRAFGYAVAETTHDCGKIGKLPQSRKRFLMVARHTEKVPPLLYEPEQHRLLTVGDVLSRAPLPGDMRAGPMHRLPRLQWQTWVRLAFVEAGKDWRSLNRLAVQDGVLRDYLIVPDMRNTALGVHAWDDSAGTVTGNARPATGAFSVADPRAPEAAKQYQQYGVRRWDETSGAITGQSAPGGGTYSVADPRPEGVRHNNVFRVVRMGDTSPAITGGAGPTAGGLALADPRPQWDRHGNNLVVGQWGEPSRTVIAGGKGVQGGWLSVADPRSGMDAERAAYLTGGHYGVLPWDGTSGAVSAAACHDNGRWSVADPRLLPAATDNINALIVAEDGTWHRPFTTWECAVMQSLVEPEEALELDGLSDSDWRERIGNAVPPAAAEAIASEMGRTLLLAWSGETFQLSAAPIWVRNVAVAISVAQGA